MRGGTGFYKINKLVRVDLSCDYKIDFKYISSNVFQIDLYIEAKQLTV